MRIDLFDYTYKKVFDLIGHRILANKLMSLDLYHSILCRCRAKFMTCEIHDYFTMTLICKCEQDAHD